jgi:hypothetical protein
MSWITVAWSMATAVCLTLLAIHLVIGVRQKSPAHLYFSLSALAAAVTAAFEFLLMRASTAPQYASILRWAHLPIWILLVSLVLFVRAYLRAGRPFWPERR